MVSIRPAEERDFLDIKEIAENTWEGQDYIVEEFSNWLKDGNFYVIDVGGKVVGTGKITILPGAVAWLEGLRVHPTYQKRGLGRKMHDFLMNHITGLDSVKYIEFATHIFNKESVSMSKKDGFDTVKRFYLAIKKRGKAGDFEEVSVSNDELMWDDYIPCGWKFLHVTKNTSEFLKKCGKFGQINGCKFLYPNRSTEVGITPVELNVECIKKVMPAANKVSKMKNSDIFAVMIPENMEIIPELKALGFESWVNFEEPDVLVFRKTLRDKN